MHEMMQKEGSMKVRTLCQVLSAEDYDNIMRVTNTSKDAKYQKSKHHFKEKFQQLKDEKQKHSQIASNNKRTRMKPPVLNLGNMI